MVSNHIPWAELDGYQVGAPSAETGRYDAAIVAQHKCQCGGDFQYYPFVRKYPYSYRGFAVCRKCAHTEEV